MPRPRTVVQEDLRCTAAAALPAAGGPALLLININEFIPRYEPSFSLLSRVAMRRRYRGDARALPALVCVQQSSVTACMRLLHGK